MYQICDIGAVKLSVVIMILLISGCYLAYKAGHKNGLHDCEQLVTESISSFAAKESHDYLLMPDSQRALGRNSHEQAAYELGIRATILYRPRTRV